MDETNWDTLTQDQKIDRLREGVRALERRLDHLPNEINRVFANFGDRIKKLEEALQRD